MSYIHIWVNGHNMDKNSNILVEKENNYDLNDLGALGLGAMLGGPIGAAAGLAGNRLYKWLRSKNLNKKNKKSTDKIDYSDDQNTETDQKTHSDKTLQQKIKKAQDEIRNTGMFEPEVYESHKFYKSTIYDERDPENNNFIFISKKPNNSNEAYKSFLDYWTNKWAAGMSGHFVGRIKGAKYRFDLQYLTWDFS